MAGERRGLWESQLDEESGGIYWWHSQTGECVWDTPSEAITAPGDALTPAPALPTPAAPVPAPSSPWEKCLDTDTGAPYWYNSVTHEASWEDPARSVASPVRASIRSSIRASGSNWAPMPPPTPSESLMGWNWYTDHVLRRASESTAPTTTDSDKAAYLAKLVSVTMSFVNCEAAGCSTRVHTGVKPPRFCYRHQHIRKSEVALVIVPCPSHTLYMQM